MLFNSYIFIFIFLPLALAGWYLLNRLENRKIAQGYLTGMSLWFYIYFNVSFLWIILGSCLFNYGISLLFERDAFDKESRPLNRKILIFAGCAGNVGALGIFKYYNFFVENMNAVFSTDFNMKNIILPLGISFITFQQISFLVDRYREELPKCGLMDYLSFVTFFPSLISGPIVLHGNTIHQFQDKDRRKFDAERFSKGVMQFVIGLGKKVLLADMLSPAVNYGYSGISSLDSLSALVVAVFYTLELYFDFSGYSDMAVGIGKMFGIDLPENFRSPYKAVSVKDFWKRWHMTLSSFLQTYVYIPLGGSRKGRLRTVVNTMITFLVSGLWHGASWTFVFWGFLHGLGVVAAGWGRKKGKEKERTAGKAAWKKRLCQAACFAYVCMAFVFFRADSMADGFSLLGRIFSFRLNGSLSAVAEAMEPSEIYIVTKALSLLAPSLVTVVQIAVLLLLLAVSFLVLAGRRTQEIIAREKISLLFTLGLSVLFAWSVISLSGVSTFVYFNF